MYAYLDRITSYSTVGANKEFWVSLGRKVSIGGWEAQNEAELQ